MVIKVDGMIMQNYFKGLASYTILLYTPSEHIAKKNRCLLVIPWFCKDVMLMCVC